MIATSPDEPVTPAWPDWRDAEQYRHMLDLDRAGWAWEWLRRNPDYAEGEQNKPPGEPGRKALTHPEILSAPVSESASRWGLCFC